MPRKGKVKRSNDSTNEKVQQKVPNSDLEEISELHGSTDQPADSEVKDKQTDSSISEENANKDKISTSASTSSQQVQEPLLTEQSTFAEEKPSYSQETLTNSMPTEKVIAEPKEKLSNSKVDEATGNEAKDKVETSTSQSSSHFLKWSNKKTVTEAKGRKKKEKKKEEKQSRQTEVSDYFAVRRSDRKCKSAIENEKQKVLEQSLLSGKDDCLEVREVEGKGRGIFAKQNFTRAQFVCEYAGELIDYKTAKEREQFYEGKTEFGCYMYYFSFRNKKLCVDATKESGRLGRLLNHSKTEANCATRLVCVQDTPRLILEAIRDVTTGEELLYDYGERSKDVIQFHQWLKS